MTFPPAAIARSNQRSTSSTYRRMLTGVPPMDRGLRYPMSGYSSASIIAESHLGVSDLSVRGGEAHCLARAERLLVELDRLRRSFDDQVRRRGVVTLGYRSGCHVFPPLKHDPSRVRSYPSRARTQQGNLHAPSPISRSYDVLVGFPSMTVCQAPSSPSVSRLNA